MNPSKNPSALRSKKEITATLLRLMDTFAYPDITVKQILMESQVARKTFYRNFSSKDDVLHAHIDNVMQQYKTALQQLPDCQISTILNLIFKFCMQNQNLLFQLRNNHLMHLLLEKWNVFIPMIHDQLVCRDHPLFSSFSPDEMDYIIAFNTGAIWNILFKWVERDMKESPDTIRTTILNYLSRLNHINQMPV